MPAKLSPPETKVYRLELLDERQGIPEAEATEVTIRQATVRQNGLRSRLFSEFITERSERKPGTERTILQLPLYDLIAEEVYLTMVGCNLTVADGTKPLFKFSQGPNGAYLDMTRTQFDDAWGLLDDDTAAEIHSKVLELNTHWIIGANENEPLGE